MNARAGGRNGRFALIFAALALTVLTVLIVASNAHAAVTVYGDEDEFDGDHPRLVTEDFEDGEVAPGAAVPCPTPLDSESDNTCFQPGELPRGVSLRDEPGPDDGGLALVGDGFGSGSTKRLFANGTGDSFVLDFTRRTNAVGFDLLAFSGDDTCSLTLDLNGGNFEDVSAPCSQGGEFLGLNASKPIESIVISTTSNNEGIDNLRFGDTITPCKKAKRKLRKAKRELRKAKDSGKRHRIKRAKREVKRAKRKVERACPTG